MESIITSVQSCRALCGGGSQPGGRGLTVSIGFDLVITQGLVRFGNLVQIIDFSSTFFRDKNCPRSDSGFGHSKVGKCKRKQLISCWIY